MDLEDNCEVPSTFNSSYNDNEFSCDDDDNDEIHGEQISFKVQKFTFKEKFL